MVQGRRPGTSDGVGGDVGTNFAGHDDDFLASCFGAEWSGDSLTMGNERITFSGDLCVRCRNCLRRQRSAGWLHGNGDP